MVKFFLYIRTITSYILLLLIGFICFIPCAIIIALPAKYRYDNRVFFWIAHIFYKACLHLLFVPLDIKGKQHIPQESAIFVANHQSSLDIPVVGSLCDGHPHAWLVLQYYARSPLIGVFVRRMNVTVDRDNAIKAARALARILMFAKAHKSHLLIFPEGRRFTDGLIHDFFQGFALLAQKTGRPVVPIYIKNNYKIFPPYSFLVHYYPLIVRIGKPFVYSSDDTPITFTQRVQDWFIQENEIS